MSRDRDVVDPHRSLVFRFRRRGEAEVDQRRPFDGEIEAIRKGVGELLPFRAERQRAVVDAFLTASREGNFDALLAVLDPDVVFRHDRTAGPLGASREITGALAVAKQFAGRAQAARPILVNGSVGVVVAPHGRLMLVLDLTWLRVLARGLDLLLLVGVEEFGQHVQPFDSLSGHKSGTAANSTSADQSGKKFPLRPRRGPCGQHAGKPPFRPFRVRRNGRGRRRVRGNA